MDQAERSAGWAVRCAGRCWRETPVTRPASEGVYLVSAGT